MDNPAKRVCPVCGKYHFKYPFEDCPICAWCNDIYQEEHPNTKHCANPMSFNQARERFKQGKELYPEDNDKWWER